MNENEENQLEASHLSVEALIKELSRRGRMTNAACHPKIMRDGIDENTKIIVTRGVSSVYLECSRCRKELPPEEFNYYQARVSGNGFLQRTNAVCKTCDKDGKDELKNAVKLTGNTLGPKPRKGDVCPHCERNWEGNWHRHHQGDEVIGWICGHCNMSFSDHRNEAVERKRGLR